MRMNRRVSVWKHVRLGNGKWRYCRPVRDEKGKIVADVVTVPGGHEERLQRFFALIFAHRALWAAAIFRRAAGDIVWPLNQRCAACEIIVSCSAASGVARTTGPPMKIGAESHFASLEKTATTSQRILLSEHDAACDSERCALNCFATR
jgi:hypothetical protein